MGTAPRDRNKMSVGHPAPERGEDLLPLLRMPTTWSVTGVEGGIVEAITLPFVDPGEYSIPVMGVADAMEVSYAR